MNNDFLEKNEICGACRVLVGKTEGKRLTEGLGRRWEHNSKMDLQEVGCDGMD